MSIHNYIEQELIRKNRGIYFRRGRWLMHVLFILIFCFASVVEIAESVKHLHLLSATLTIGVGLAAPFLVFIYFYCLYLIPYCFKLNRYRRFWTILLLMMALFPLIDIGLKTWAKPYLPGMEAVLDKGHPFQSVVRHYFTFISGFIGFACLLYFMELLEGISTDKETAENQSLKLATELHLLKTRMNPAFMVRSLDGIIALEEQQGEHAPDSVVGFSDVLRYRLYRSKERLVPLGEELAQLGNLMRLHNVLPGQEDTCSLETEGDIENTRIVPLSLINIAEPLLATFKPGGTWSLLMYLLMEEKEIQVAVELSAEGEEAITAETQRIHQDLQRLLYSGLNFTVEKEQNTFSLRTCIPIFRNLTVSS
ncbi:histidine kinase [Taibaiella koreensis]|uniref:histidine kinase n=1 Tax=Taibaiella koreensis TaxID=1268548 RepID=UPI000E59EE66|nr:sensor histidine kinase [Taibaiella koreensis]